jgi:hypothetical protein
VKELIGEYLKVDYMCAMEHLCPEIAGKTDTPLLPVQLYLTYEWNLD